MNKAVGGEVYFGKPPHPAHSVLRRSGWNLSKFEGKQSLQKILFFSSLTSMAAGFFDPPINAEKYLCSCDLSHPQASLTQKYFTSNISSPGLIPFDLDLPKVLSWHADKSHHRDSQPLTLLVHLQGLVGDC